jgi:hypothetical protein
MSLSVSACDAEATLGQFHLFGSLPPELRFMIWTAAARSVKRGVHFFGARPMSQGDPEIIDALALVAPKIRDASGSVRTWVDGKRSTYCQDFGLWMACRESRACMLRHYQRLEDAINEEEDVDTFFGGQSRFMDFGEGCISKVFPTHDLLCLQPLETHPSAGALGLFEQRDGSRHGGSNRFNNIALEYNPAWMNGLVRVETEGARERAREYMWRENSPRGVFIRTLWAMAKHAESTNTTFWLVDYSIQRREKALNVYLPFDFSSDEDKGEDDEDNEAHEKAKPEPRVFHGMDSQFVEVQDLSECKCDGPRPNTAFHFLHGLQIDVGFGIHWMVSRRPSQNPTPMPHGLEDLVKVLCVEPN